MKLFSTLAITFFTVGLLAIQLPATAASKNDSRSAKVHQVVYKNETQSNTSKFKTAVRRASAKQSEFFARIASKPREFFQRHAAPVRERNEGVPLEASINVPRPVVSESSIF